MIIINHNLSQCLSHCHFNRFNCDAKAYAADINTEKSDCSEKKLIYHTINNDNSFKESESKEDNSAINFTLSESF